MPGPLPKDPSSRRRRNVSVGKVVLPAEGRSGDAPVWPFRNAVEPYTWAGLWGLPQAVEWERLHLVRVVARYAVLSESVESAVDVRGPVLAEVRQLEDRLGLSAKSMRAMLWVIGDAEDSQGAPVSSLVEKRRRLKVV